MSRSYKKTPIIGYTGESEKEDKKIWHSRMRAQVRTRLNSVRELEEYMDVKEDEVSSPWDMSKDGKHYLTKDIKKWIRK